MTGGVQEVGEGVAGRWGHRPEGGGACMVCLHRGWDPATLVLNHRLEPSGATGDLGDLCWGSPPSALLQVLPHPACPGERPEPHHWPRPERPSKL